jgi:hypothetical protein
VIIIIFVAMIDFIQQLIAGFDYPGLKVALDPITTALLVGTGVQQIGKAIGAGQQRRASAREARRGKDLYDRMVSDFQEGKFDQRLSQDVRDAAEQQRILAEQATDAATQRAEAMQQSALAAARYGDPRSAALIPAQTRQLESGIQQAEISGLGQKVAADMNVAQQQQAVDQANTALQQQLASLQLQRGAARMDAGRLARQQARQAQIDALTGLAATAATGLVARGMEGGSDTTTNPTRTLNPNPIIDSLGILTGTSGSGMGSLGTQLNFDGSLNLDGDPTNSMKHGGEYAFANKNGNVFMTEGEFDHGTNKKALVDEETGEKEAELTGDEAMVVDGDNLLVFNPDQQKTIEGLVNLGDSDQLMVYLKELLTQFEKQDE